MTRAASPILLVALVIVGAACTTSSRRTSDSDSKLDRVANAYQAYAEDDCATVAAGFDTVEIHNWKPSEVRSAYHLLEAFCAERASQTDRARRLYRTIVRETPLSFAADDARERLRIMRRAENDAGYVEVVEKARARARAGSSARAAVERSPALYPPLAHHANISGHAIVEFGVTPAGTTDAPVVVDSSPPFVFDGAALRAVRNWRYETDLSGDASARQAIRLVFRPDDGTVAPMGDAATSGDG